MATTPEPLATRMRPRSLDEIRGHSSLLRDGSVLRGLLGGTGRQSVILWGPPGSGKTTLARLLALNSAQEFTQLSAVDTGVREVRALIVRAETLRREEGRASTLFLDEIHRFSRSQQDSLLGAVESGILTLVAATTENPAFSVIGPLRSRCVSIALEPLDETAVGEILDAALLDSRGLGGQFTLTPEARTSLAGLAQGDARWALTVLETASQISAARGAEEITLADTEVVADRTNVQYDATGDAHYDVTSAFIKSIRGSDPDAALHYLARMLRGGEDPRYIARRLMVHASEDIGLADPSALVAATAAAQVVALVGLPEARLALAQATLHLACAPKSNSVLAALEAALADVDAGRGARVPVHLRDAHAAGARALGHGQGYQYPHDEDTAVSPQHHLPDTLRGRVYFHPSTHGQERSLGERLERIRQILRRAR